MEIKRIERIGKFRKAWCCDSTGNGWKRKLRSFDCVGCDTPRKSMQHRAGDLRISSNPISRAKDRRRTELSRMIPLNWLPSAHLPTYLPTFVLVYRREEREQERKERRGETERRSERGEKQIIIPGIRKTRKRTRDGRGRRAFIQKRSDRMPFFTKAKYHFSHHLGLLENALISR